MKMSQLQERFRGTLAPDFKESGAVAAVLAVKSSTGNNNVPAHKMTGETWVYTSHYPELRGVETVELEFVGGEVISIRLIYEETNDPNIKQELPPKTKESLGLTGDWQVLDTSNLPEFTFTAADASRISCDGFSVTTGTTVKRIDSTAPIKSGEPYRGVIYSPFVRIKDLGAEAKMQAIRNESLKQMEEEEKRKRQAFTP